MGMGKAPSQRTLREMYAELGNALMKVARAREALPLLETALTEPGGRPPNGEIALCLSDALESVGRSDDAFALLVRTLPSGGVATKHIAENIERLLPSIDLARHSDQVSSIDWGHVQAKARSQAAKASVALAAGSILAAGRDDGAYEFLSEATSLSAQDSRAPAKMARLFREQGNLDQAVPTFNVALARAKAADDALEVEELSLELAETLLANGSTVDAVAVLPIVTTNDEMLTRAKLVRAAAALFSGDPAKSEELAREVVSSASGSHLTAATVILARSLIAAHRNQDAISVIDSALDDNPADVELGLVRLQAVLEEQTSIDESIEKLGRLCALNEGGAICSRTASDVLRGREADGRAHFFSAFVLKATGDNERALQAASTALASSERSDSDYPKGPILALQAGLLQDLGQKLQALDVWEQAGLAFYGANDYKKAIECLQTVLARSPDRIAVAWHLADALLMSALSLDVDFRTRETDDEAASPRNRRYQEQLTRAQSVWHDARRRLGSQLETHRGESYPAWARVTLARINHALLLIPGTPRESLIWDAVTNLEGSLLEEEWNSWAWRLLVESYRLLDLPACVRETAAAAAELLSFDEELRRWRVVVYFDDGEHHELLAALNELESDFGEGLSDQWAEAWAYAMKGHALLRLGKHDESLPHAEAALAILGDEAALWVYEVAAFSQWAQGDVGRALETFDKAISGYQREKVYNPLWRGPALLYLGRVAEAKREFAMMADEPADTQVIDGLMGLAVCALYEGDEGAQIRRVIHSIRKSCDLEALEASLMTVAYHTASQPAPTVRKAIPGLLEAVREARRVIARRVGAREELNQLSREPVQGEVPSEQQSGAYATLGRLSVRAGDWEEASRYYGALYQDGAFLEAELGLLSVLQGLNAAVREQLANGGVHDASTFMNLAEGVSSLFQPGGTVASMLVGFGDELFGRSLRADALARYDSALRRLATGEPSRQRAALYARISLVHQTQGSTSQAEKRMLDALGEYRRVDETSAGRDLCEDLRPLVQTIEQYWHVDSLLSSLDRQSPVAQEAAHDLRDAINSLPGILADLLGLAPTHDDAELLAVIPMVAEVGSDLVPYVDPASDGGVFIEELIPRMRERIHASTGVTVPGVRLRGDASLSANGYVIQVDEVPVMEGTISLDEAYKIDGPLADAADGTVWTNFNPRTGEPGTWTISLEVKTPQKATLLPIAEFLIFLLEEAMRSHLHRFFGPQELEAWLGDWSTESGPQELIASVVPDVDARLALTWLLQDVLADGLPINDGPRLLRAIMAGGGLSASNARSLRRWIRLHFREELSGRQSGRTLIRVPEALEEKLLAEHENPDSIIGFVSAAHELLRWLHSGIASSLSSVTLVSTTETGRELVDDIVRSENKKIDTLWEQEAPDDGQY